MKTLPLTAMIGIMLMATSCSNDLPEGDDGKYGPISIELTRSNADAVKSINEFSFDLLRATEKRFSEDNPNYIISPQSAAWAIAMAANGAAPGTETQKEMVEVLRLDKGLTITDVNDLAGKIIKAIAASGRSDIAIANAVHYDSSINIQNSFLDLLKTFYSADSFADPTDTEIDGWISEKTGNLITDFARKNNLSRCPFGILNTMWFNGFWAKEFDPEYTREEDFRNADGTVGSPMMMQGNIYCERNSNEMCHFLRINFKGDAFAINFILPAEGHDLKDIAEYFDVNHWIDLIDVNNAPPTIVNKGYTNVWIPRLKMKNDFNLIDVMRDMGMKKAFSDETELSGIASENVKLMKFLHSTTFELEEKGAKAAVVSYAPGTTTSTGSKSFHLDEPFYFFITEQNTGAILFLGRVSQL